MDAFIEWVLAHNFPFKVIDNHIYWQTNIQTGEAWEAEDGAIHLRWHGKKFFETLKKC